MSDLKGKVAVAHRHLEEAVDDGDARHAVAPSFHG
jgi:hypothetical protein